MYDDNPQPPSKRNTRFGKLAILATALLAAIGMASLPLAAAAAVQEAKLTATDAASSDGLGQSVALDGDTALVGAPGDDDAGSGSGSAYVFVRNGTTWSQQAKLTAADATAFDSFGESVAVDGDTALVGAAFDDDHGSSSGSAYVFVRNGTTWSQQAKLTATDAAAFDNFGISVALDGERALIGAHRDGDNGTDAGSAYVFTRTGANWTQQAKLTASDAAPGAEFGDAVALDGETALVGAHMHDGTTGSAYVFVRNGTTWTQQANLTASSVAGGEQFGTSVALDGDTGLVGARLSDDNGTNSGSAYVFTRNGTTWSQQAKLTASDAAQGDLLGQAVAVDGDTAVVGAFGDNEEGTDAGAAYVFIRNGTGWTEDAKLTATDAAAGDEFGVSLALDGETTLVGAHLDDNATDAGSAYVFNLTPAEEQQRPACPEGLRAQAHNNEDISLSWNVSVDAETYHVYRASGDSASEHVAEVTSTSYTDTTTEAETTYVYEVTAANEAGEAEDCPTVEVTAIPFFVSPVLIVMAVLVSIGAVAVVWARRG